MAKSSFVRSAVQSAIKNLDQGTKIANEVIESSGKSATRATMIKNCVNTVKSNMSDAQAKNIARAAANGIDNQGMKTATNVVNTKAVNNVVGNTNGGTTSAAQKAYEVVKAKRTGQAINGHNAQARQTQLDTIVNDIKDRQATRDLNTTKKSIPIQEMADNIKDVQSRTTRVGNTVIPANVATGANRATTMDIDKAYARQNLLNGNGDISGIAGDIKTSEITGNYNRSTGPSQQAKQESAKQSLSNKDKLINGIKDDIFGGLTETYQNGIKGDKGLWDSFVGAHTKDDGSIRLGRAAGTFMAASAAARVATGGGLYKDRYGNPNIIGVPFI